MAAKTLSRYLAIEKAFIHLSLMHQMQYRGNWILSTLNTVGWGLMRLVYYMVAFSVVGTIGGWNYGSSLVLAGTFILIQSVYKLFFEYNLRSFVQTIYHGDLDFILTKPINSQFHISTRRFTPRSGIRALFGIGILALAFPHISVQMSIANIVSYLYMCFLGLIFMYTISFIIMTCAFWLGNVTPLTLFPQALTSMSYMPYDIFGSSINAIITWLIPLMFITTIPAKTLLNPNPTLMIAATLLAVVSLILSQKFWELGLRCYSSAN